MNYANAKGIPYVIMAGENERAQGVYTLKNMQTGEQQSLSAENILDLLKNNSLSSLEEARRTKCN